MTTFTGTDWELPSGQTIRTINLAEQGMYVSMRDLVAYLNTKADSLPRDAVINLLLEMMRPQS